MAKTVVTEEQSPPVQTGLLLMSWRDIVRIFLIGVVAGVVTLALMTVLDRYVFSPILCANQTEVIFRCENKDNVAATAATVLAAIGALFALVQARVYRPLLVVLLATIALWNLTLLISGMHWLLATLAAGLLFGLAYAVFAWLSQVRSFALAAATGAVLVVLVRLILVA